MSKELEVAVKAAKEAGQYLKNNFGKRIDFEVKEDKTFVSELDRKAEEIIISSIKENFPDHGVIAEESVKDISKSPYKWYVDPLDGSGNFLASNPLFAVSIALVINDQPLFGVVYLPIVDQFFRAEKNKGAYLNDKPIKVSGNSLERETVHFGRSTWKYNEEFLATLEKTLSKIRSPRVLGSIAIGIAYVASGGFAASISLGSNSWDHSAGALLVEEAGGKVTDFKGNPWSPVSNYILATNGKVHKELLDLINK